MGGCTGHQGVVIFTPVGRLLFKAPLGKQKTGHHPEDTRANDRPFATGCPM
jgi:hypothetical protein